MAALSNECTVSQSLEQSAVRWWATGELWERERAQTPKSRPLGEELSVLGNAPGRLSVCQPRYTHMHTLLQRYSFSRDEVATLGKCLNQAGLPHSHGLVLF